MTPQARLKLDQGLRWYNSILITALTTLSIISGLYFKSLIEKIDQHSDMIQRINIHEATQDEKIEVAERNITILSSNQTTLFNHVNKNE